MELCFKVIDTEMLGTGMNQRGVEGNQRIYARLDV